MAKSGVSPAVYAVAALGALAVMGGIGYMFMQIDPPEAPAPVVPLTPMQLAAAADAAPADPAAWARLCAATAKNFWRESSPADCDRAVELGADAVQPRLDRAFLNLKIGMPDKAFEGLEDVLAKQPREPRALFGRALITIQRGDLAGSAPDRRAAIAANPNVVTELEAAYDFKVPPEYRS